MASKELFTLYVERIEGDDYHEKLGGKPLLCNECSNKRLYRINWIYTWEPATSMKDTELCQGCLDAFLKNFSITK